jgi:glyoxylase-like metal-dependent hydrolase (beta-lactamase superfamily II)
MTDTNLSRRQLLAAAPVTALAGLMGSAAPALAKAPMLHSQAPAYYRFKIGNIEATIVSDGLMVIGAPEKMFLGPSAPELGQMMTEHFLPADNIVLDQNALVINTGDKLALFESGMSSVKRTNEMGLMTRNLRAAGIDPKDIDYIIPSHGHIDHIGGILAEDGSPNYPNAQIYISQADFDYWTNERLRGTPQEGSMLAARKNLLPFRDRILFYSDGKEVIPAVQAVLTPGHTVGHTCFVISSGGNSLYFAGDLVHHALSVEKPRMVDVFDGDRALAAETRVKHMGRLADDRMTAIVYHLPWPGLGHFTRRGDGFHFEPANLSVVL